MVLPAGVCNLYLFPKIVPKGDSLPQPPSAAGVAVLNHFIRSIAEHRAFDQPDPVGAYPIHALSARMPYEAAWT